jgi:hypothetical protein
MYNARAVPPENRRTVSYDEITERVAEIGDAFRTRSAFIGCSMFFTVAMIVDRINAAWPDPAAIGGSALLWLLILVVQCRLFEATRQRTAERLNAALQAWYLGGPAARGANVIQAEPLGITYEHFGRRKRAVIQFLWSKIEFKLGQAHQA